MTKIRNNRHQQTMKKSSTKSSDASQRQKASASEEHGVARRPRMTLMRHFLHTRALYINSSAYNNKTTPQTSCAM